jgi:hypothetical protein
MSESESYSEEGSMSEEEERMSDSSAENIPAKRRKSELVTGEDNKNSIIIWCVAF